MINSRAVSGAFKVYRSSVVIGSSSQKANEKNTLLGSAIIGLYTFHVMQRRNSQAKLPT